MTDIIGCGRKGSWLPNGGPVPPNLSSTATTRARPTPMTGRRSSRFSKTSQARFEVPGAVSESRLEYPARFSNWARRLSQELHATGLEIVNATGDLNFPRALQIAQDRAEFANARHRQPDMRLADGFDEFGVL